MIKTNRDLVAFVESKLNVHTMYMLGGFGRVLTQGMINYRINMPCVHTRANRLKIESGIGRYVYDCVGVIKGGLWEIEKGNVRYDIPVGSDQNVGMMYRSAKEKGAIATMPDIKGLLVYTADLGHVGIYVGKKNGVNQYVEATPAWGAWGVTTSADRNHPQGHNRKWAYWGKYHLIDYLEPVSVIKDVYTVVKGDYLSKIAPKVNMTTEELYDLNKDVIGDNPNLIEVGMMLRLKPNIVFVPKYVETVKEVIKEVEVIKEIEKPFIEVFERNGLTITVEKKVRKL